MIQPSSLVLTYYIHYACICVMISNCNILYTLQTVLFAFALTLLLIW